MKWYVLFIPVRVFFEPRALEYPLARRLLELFTAKQVEIRYTSSHNRVTGIPGKTRQQGFREARRTLIIGVRQGKTFQTCRPSAHYQLPITTSCPGMCEYCYLLTNLGQKPYLRTYVNIDEILAIATGSLARIITFFAGQETARFRFVTKFTDVDSLLWLDHRGHTRWRFSVNADAVIQVMQEMASFFRDKVRDRFPEARFEYIV